MNLKIFKELESNKYNNNKIRLIRQFLKTDPRFNEGVIKKLKFLAIAHIVKGFA